MLAAIIVVSLVSAGAGVAAAMLLGGGDDRSPPAPTVLTAAVERRVLEGRIVTRGDARYTGSFDVSVAASSALASGGPLVVSGRVPTIGDAMIEGDVAVEIRGRPVILLRGAVPMYRSMGPGATGPDVAQLNGALERLGLAAEPLSPTFDARTSRAVGELYGRAGYQPVPANPDAPAQQRAAGEAVASAEQALRSARAALAAASRGPSESERVAAQGAVTSAESALEAAVAARDATLADADPDEHAELERQHDQAVLDAQIALDVARARLAEVQAPPDASAQAQAVDAAQQNLDRARGELAAITATAGASVPLGEVIFVPDLPRQVTAVGVVLGGEVDGPVLTLSGGGLEVVASITASEAQLVHEGDAVTLDDETLGVETTGEVLSVAQSPGTDGVDAVRHAVHIRPAADAAIAGMNLRVTLLTGTTDGRVLVVPITALVTGVDGRTSILVLADDAEQTSVPVEVGLVANGDAEIRPIESAVEPGDQVILGLP